MKKIQSVLVERGFRPGTVNGRYNPGTERALKEFSKSKNIAFNNFLTPDLTGALFGIRIDYENATPEQRLDFLHALGLISK